MIIAIGNSRRDKAFKIVDVTWEQFLNKVSKTIRTVETVDEYGKMNKAKKDDIKDVGGFVGGKLKDGRRSKDSVEFRSMLTLDLDYAENDLWEQVTKRFKFACCIYSTHKHKRDKHRLRLIIPLSRNVNADEYTAIGRLIASDIGIEQFDDSTYEPARLMYWPSTSSNGEFIFEKQDGEFLNPDSILSRYEDYRDSSKWPISSRQNKVIKNNISHQMRALAKQSNPLEKEGLIGAFCRAYTMEEAIDKFLNHIYKPSLIKGRYDYVEADSTSGLVIYEDKFAYSHHATDKAANVLCNAFDLVRIHKFSELDVNSDEDTRTSRLPSFKAMRKFCTKDELVQKQITNEKMKDIGQEFGELEDNDNKLEIDLTGEIKDTLNNIVKILRNDKNLHGIAYNKHKDMLDVKGKLPWIRLKEGWNDSDLASLKIYLEKKYNIWSPAKLKDALLAVATERAFHPVIDYLENLEEWDGKERLETLLIKYLGAEDNAYTREVTRKTLVAAIARVYEPGVKFDSVLILNGKQGMGKSTLFSKLGGKWFSDNLTLEDMKDKTAAEKLQGFWIMELGELAGMRKAEVENVKSFITRTDDKYRASYGVNVESHPRQCIIVGTTNNKGGFLRDVTGNRRFWPVTVDPDKALSSPWDLEDVDKIWAEALYVYKQGEELYLKGEVLEIASKEQSEAMESDDREGLVREYLNKLLPNNWSSMNLYERRKFLNGDDLAGGQVGTEKRKAVCSMEIWCECFGKDASSLKKSDSYEITAIMSKIEGWELYSGNKTNTMRFPIYNKQRAFVRVE
ncbi:virulence-associated E family protein [Clostridium sp. NSJ-145]|uniref:virulence-associated E family protein n=1 Tax=Clostridium sp. NSJ-145 TaxID=2897777 RepID=UPI001E3891AF|nr:virulence-associated E family protein [Clostridium sp. NSJ-145]MCD2503221.1 virulence-associated E family protein [Clostridium sp. NSJ-145]